MALAERELLEVYEVAKKAAEAAEENGNPADVDRCVDALQRLREIPVTVKVLVDTQVGKKIRSHLTKHPLKKIQKAASDLCELWKKKVIEETSKKKDNGSDEKKSVKVELRSVNADSPKARKVSADTIGDHKSEAVKIEKISADTIGVQSSGVNGTVHKEKSLVEKNSREEKRPFDKKPSYSTIQPPKLTSVIKCNDLIRDKTRELFAEALSKVSGEAKDDIRDKVEACDPLRVSILLESVMFEKLGRSNGTQKQKYRSILFNLKDQNNPDLRRRVLLGEIKPEDIINMTAEEMASDERKLQNKQIKEKALFECERGLNNKASTDQFKCGRCGQRKCTYYQLQTRSADEPMTTYVTCVNCNNRWKFC